MSSIVWFRRDLRVADNPTLQAACLSCGDIAFVYVHAPEEEAPWAPGAASRWWLHHSLAALDAELAKRGQRLLILRGASAPVLAALAKDIGARDIHAGTLMEPAIRCRDEVVRQHLAEQGIALHLHAPNLLSDPEAVRTAKGEPYRVFTPFWRQVRSKLMPDAPGPVPQLPNPPGVSVQRDALDALRLLPRVAWDFGFDADWTPGEAGAHRALSDFMDDVSRYAEARNRPDQAGTSRLSPHLHFGEITPRQIAWAMRGRGQFDPGEAFLRELGWREFCHHLLWHFPYTTDAPMDARFADYPWQQPPDPALLAAWQQGRTGIPMVDAGMRELWHTGWMHNRVRMIVASLLTKNLRIHWLHGARWFWDTLVDADLANNTAGWQWTAGSGADAAPYFRIFNPVLQGQRFDPRGDYVRRWIPELSKVPAPSIHSPWTLSVAEQRDFGIDDTPYARPLIDLAQTRNRALEGLAEMRNARPHDARANSQPG